MRLDPGALSTADIARLAARPPQLRLTALQRELFDESAAYDAMLQAAIPLLRRVASSLVPNDPDQAEELLQMARLKLWKLGASRLDAMDVRKLKRVLVNEMKSAMRAERVRSGDARFVRMHVRLV